MQSGDIAANSIVSGVYDFALNKALVSAIVVSQLGNLAKLNAGTMLTNIELATFTDSTPGRTAADYVALVDWGDGSPEQPAQVTDDAGTFVVRGSHTYSTPKGFLVSVAINSPTDSAAVFSTAAITAPVVVSETPLTLLVSGNLQFQHKMLASFTTSNPNDVGSNYTAIIDWGDGSPVDTGGAVYGSGGNLYVAGGHKYTMDGVVPLSPPWTGPPPSFPTFRPSLTAQSM